MHSRVWIILLGSLFSLTCEDNWRNLRNLFFIRITIYSNLKNISSIAFASLVMLPLKTSI